MISNRMATGLRTCSILFAAFAGTWTAPAALAQTATEVDQTVDQVAVFSSDKLLRLKFDLNPPAFVGLAAQPLANLRACETSNVNGLFCLDAQIVRQWPSVLEDPLPPEVVVPDPGAGLFSCHDDALGLAESNPCSAMTVDGKGNIWIAGRKPVSNLYSLFRIVRKDSVGACPLGSSTLSNKQGGNPLPNLEAIISNYCYSELVTGRPLILDLSPVDGDLVDAYFSGPGIIGVENRDTAVFYPNSNPQATVEIGGWDLPAGESVASASILQRQDGAVVRTYALIATSLGRVFSRPLPSGDTSMFVHVNSDSDDLRVDRGSACLIGVATNQIRLRASETSGRVFVTNRNYCKTFVMAPLYDANDVIVGVDLDALLVLSTGTTVPPDGLSVAPGLSVDIGNCKPGDPACVFLGDGDGNGFPAVKMYDVTLEEGSPRGLTIYKIVNIPDCRYILNLNPLSSLPADHPCRKPRVVIKDPKIADASANLPQRQFLNVTPMLPSTVTDVFDGSGKKPLGLPDLLIQPRYRAQAINDYVFGALFGVADPNIRFRKTFTVEFDIGDPNLAGINLGCGVHQSPVRLPFNQWDIGTVVSERYSSVGGPRGAVKDTTVAGLPYPAEHVDTLINKGCYNPTPKAGTRWSMYSYNLELAEDSPVRAVTPGPITGFVYSPAVKYLGNLLLSLHTELGDAQKKLACQNVDALGNTGLLPTFPPLDAPTCTTLNLQWNAAHNAMKICANAANSATSYPAVCENFSSAFQTYQNTVQALVITGGLEADPANRAGELWSRTDVIRHVFNDQFRYAAPALNAQYLPGTP